MENQDNNITWRSPEDSVAECGDICELDPNSLDCRFPFLRDIDPYQAVGIISIFAVIVLLLSMYIVPAIRNHSKKKKSKSQTQTQRQPKQK